MFYSNPGYIGQSMSVRAKHAYDEGLLPLSKITATLLKKHNIPINLNFLKWLIKNEYVKPTEWHHTGKLFNRTNFYDLEDVKEQLKELDLKILEEKFKQTNVNSDNLGYYAKIEYKEWSGSRKYGRYYTETDYAFVYNGWAHISPYKKKRIDGKNIEIIKTYKRKPPRMDKTIRDDIFKKLKLI